MSRFNWFQASKIKKECKKKTPLSFLKRREEGSITWAKLPIPPSEACKFHADFRWGNGGIFTNHIYLQIFGNKYRL